MNEDDFNAVDRAAEQFDALITAAQTGILRESEDETGIAPFVEWARTLQPDPAFATRLQNHLIARHPARQRIRRRAQRLLIAAGFALVMAALIVARLDGSGKTPTGAAPSQVVVAGLGTPTPGALPASPTLAPTATLTATPTSTPSATPMPRATQTPVALAATSTVAVELDATLAAVSFQTQQAEYQLTAVVILSTATPLPSSTPPPATARPPMVDVLFLPDAAGLEALRSDFPDLLSEIAAFPVRPDIRFGLVGSTRVIDFTADMYTFQAALGDAQAGAGLNGLRTAVDLLDWREAPAASRMILVVGDSLEAAEGYQQTAVRAASRGITIHTIALSGNAAESDLAGQVVDLIMAALAGQDS